MTQTISIGFYNVENLFDIFDDKQKLDDEFTPENDRKWTEKKYENKTFKIARTLKLFNDDESLPMFLGLCEIENKKVIEDILQHDNLAEKYEIVHYNSPDERGIDVALLYNHNEFFLTESFPIEVNYHNEQGIRDFTRDILYVNGTYKGVLLHIFVVHLPSKREQDVNRNLRIFAMQQIKNQIDKIKNEYQNPAILVLGDFNSNPDEDELKDILNTEANENVLTENQLFNPFELLYKNQQFSTYHKDEGLLFDQILLSRYFLDKDSILQFKAANVHNIEKLQNYDKRFENQPFRTYRGNQYLGGFSDHFPVKVTFKV